MKHSEIDMEKAEVVAPKLGVLAGMSKAEYHGGEGISENDPDAAVDALNESLG